MRTIHNAGSKQAFFDWSTTENANKYSISVAITCIERISEYYINKKICHTDFWGIMQPDDFDQIYTKILDAKLLRILGRKTYKTYKTFIIVGQLYLKFLKEKLASNIGADAEVRICLNQS